MRLCDFDGCIKKHVARGFCTGHYNQMWDGRPLSQLGGWTDTHGMNEAERFWFYVDKSGDCWRWTAATDSDGYGVFSVDRRAKQAHRFAWELENGPAPRGSEIDHQCRNIRCVRPSHLKAVTKKANQENRSGPNRNSKSGVLGVSPVGKSWQATVGHHGRHIYIGTFPTIAEAEIAVIAKRNELFTNNILDRKVS